MCAFVVRRAVLETCRSASGVESRRFRWPDPLHVERVLQPEFSSRCKMRFPVAPEAWLGFDGGRCDPEDHVVHCSNQVIT